MRPAGLQAKRDVGADVALPLLPQVEWTRESRAVDGHSRAELPRSRWCASFLSSKCLCLKHFWANWEGAAPPHERLGLCFQLTADPLQPSQLLGLPARTHAGRSLLAPRTAATQEAPWGAGGWVKLPSSLSI